MKSFCYDHTISDIGYFWSQVGFQYDGCQYSPLYVVQIVNGCRVLFEVFDTLKERTKYKDFLSESLIRFSEFESTTSTIADDCVRLCNVPDSSFMVDYLLKH